ncbi:MAG: HigA family addiction module antidote protein [Actinomycetia bacterium]|nr:HigA family addiction module antidote protein [Actinomycetes bacterium]
MVLIGSDNLWLTRLLRDYRIVTQKTRISKIIHKKRRVTADTALRLAKFFGNTPQFWLGLQNDYDIEEEKSDKNAELKKIQQLQVV